MSRIELWPESVRHRGLKELRLYGMPCLSAKYTSDDVASYTWTGDYPVCVACGRVASPHAVHHEPPRGKGSLLLPTKMGSFALKPALVLLCKRCHDDRHDRKLLGIEWVWDSEDDERKWCDGTWLSRGLEPHGSWLFEHGFYVFDHRGYSWDVRGDGHSDLFNELMMADSRRSLSFEKAKERIGWTGDEREG